MCVYDTINSSCSLQAKLSRRHTVRLGSPKLFNTQRHRLECHNTQRNSATCRLRRLQLNPSHPKCKCCIVDGSSIYKEVQNPHDVS